MKSGSLYISVYDITKDRERYRLSKILEAYGVRIQRSAFELRLTRSQRDTMLKQIHALNLRTGWVVLYRIDEAATRHSSGILPQDDINAHGACFIH